MHDIDRINSAFTYRSIQIILDEQKLFLRTLTELRLFHAQKHLVELRDDWVYNLIIDFLLKDVKGGAARVDLLINEEANTPSLNSTMILHKLKSYNSSNLAPEIDQSSAKPFASEEIINQDSVPQSVISLIVQDEKDEGSDLTVEKNEVTNYKFDPFPEKIPAKKPRIKWEEWNEDDYQ